MSDSVKKPEEQFSSEWAICPYCHYKHVYFWNWMKGYAVKKTVCDGCGKTFTVRCDYSFTYCSSPIPEPPA